VYALNLPLSPEKFEFWVRADPISLGVGNTGDALKASVIRPPGVPDSIELNNDYGVTRRASESPKGPWPNIPDREDSSRVWLIDVKGDTR